MEKVGRNIRWDVLLAAVSIFLLIPPTVVSAQSAAEKALLVRAQTLATGGHLDIAAQIWQQVLLADSGNQEALLGIAKADMQLGKTDEAKNYLNRLRAAGGSAAEISRIETMPSVQAQSERLSEAGRLAQAGRYADALQIYRDIFGDRPPAGDSALAYYDTEAAIPENRPHAIGGLRRLAKQFPADSRYAVTLGRILTYDPKTRTEGIAMLRQYGGIPAAQSALQQAEAWDATAAIQAPTTGEEPLPGLKATAGNPLEDSAYRALNAGRMDEARQQFQSILEKQPDNSLALSGMGYVSMKQQDFAAAADYLERARTAGARGLDSIINTAQFFQKMAQAGDDSKAGNAATAVEGYRAALSLKPSSVDALEGLGGTLAQAGDNVEASNVFERAVRVAPQQLAAWRGLLLAQSSAGNAQAALDTNDRMPKGIRSQLSNDPDYLRAMAQNDLALGRKAEADRIIQQALALPFPNEGRDLSLQRQIQYAALLMTAKKYEPAIRLYRQVIAQDPESAAAWLDLIAAQHQIDQNDEALASIGRMPQSIFDQEQNNPAFLILVGSIYQSRQEWDRAQKYLERALSISPDTQPGIALQLADVYAAQGNTQKAYVIYRRELDQNPDSQQAWQGVLNALHQANRDRDALRQLASMPDPVRLRLEQEPSYLQTFASIQAATGQTQAALKTFAQLSQIYGDQNMSEPIDLQIQYGWVLLKASDDHNLYALVSSLANSSDMTDDQQTQLNRLWASWSLQRANNLLLTGDQRRALAILEAAAQAFPKNPDLDNALAGAYLKAGEPKQAVAIYSSFNMDQATLSQYRGAIGAALSASDMKHAETWLESALGRYKTDPAILKMAAQFEQARGNSKRAAAYYQAALNAMGPAGPTDIFSAPGSSDGPGSPTDSPSPAQRLMQLLAPGGRTARMNEPPDSREGDRNGDVSWQDAPVRKVSTLGDFAQAGQDSGEAAQQDTQRKRTSTLSDYAQPDRTDTGTTIASTPRQMDFVDPPRHISAHGSQALSVDRPRAVKTDSPSQLSSPPLKRDAVAPSVDLTPISTTLEQTHALVQPQDRIPYRQMSSDNDSNPPGRLQVAVRKMDGQTEGGQSWQPDNSGTPAPVQTNSNENFLNMSPTTNSTQSSELPPLTGPVVPVERPKTDREQIEEQLAVIQGTSSGWLGGASGVDYRSGQPGYDRLAIYTGQIEASGMIAPDVRTTVIVRPVILDSGQALSTATLQQGIFLQQGTLPVGSVPSIQTAAGVGGEIQLRTASFGASLGYTPHGFLVENVTGSLYIHPPSSHFTLTFSRDPVLDTQLSYAGLRDLGSATPTFAGNAWGGVLANAGELQVAYGDNRAGWYIQGGGQYITGLHVQDNRRIDGDAGAYWAVWNRPEDGNLTLGMNFFGMHYDNNLRYFTYGQGGYFSPGAYMLAGIPFTFNGHRGTRFHYRATGSLGIQAFQEESSPYYPLDPAIQAAGNLFYPENVSVGANYSLTAEGAYTIADHWYVGGYLDFNNTRDYASEKVGFFVRYVIRPQSTSEKLGPTGLFPIQGLRPLQVP
jgi:cellulose synthase operon protein C